MTRNEIIRKCVGLVTEGIKTENIGLIYEAFSIAGDNDISMVEDDEFVTIEDDVFYFNGARF